MNEIGAKKYKLNYYWIAKLILLLTFKIQRTF